MIVRAAGWLARATASQRALSVTLWLQAGDIRSNSAFIISKFHSVHSRMSNVDWIGAQRLRSVARTRLTHTVTIYTCSVTRLPHF